MRCSGQIKKKKKTLQEHGTRGREKSGKSFRGVSSRFPMGGQGEWFVPLETVGESPGCR